MIIYIEIAKQFFIFFINISLSEYAYDLFLQIVTLKDKTFVLQYDYYAIQYYFKPLLLNTK